ncbi:MAG TPA: transposase [Planctomycetaceae bacterium]|nr:transposase [Planctomycetaceae bacterium]
MISFVDGKPLFVGGCTKDPDARRGSGAGGLGWGYKLHTIWANRCLPEAWDVTPLNASESVVAQTLLATAGSGGYLLADGSYETNPLAEAAGQAGYQLVAAPRRKNAGQGHRRHSVFRQRGLELQQQSFGRRLFRNRYRIELAFAHATSFGGGLTMPPPWVRRQRRIRTWVWAKLLINAVRILSKQ